MKWLLGLVFSLKNKQTVAPWSWVIFFFGVSLVCFGSGYYHWNPNTDTLIWDRLPMTIGFMGLFIGILSEYVSPKIERRLLIPAVVLGFSSVVVWAYTDDLRFYFWIQLVPLLTIPLALILFKGAYTLQRFLVYALVFYILAKLAELYDKDIFDLDSGIISGHSLKRILAALAALSLYLMLKRRQIFNRAM